MIGGSCLCGSVRFEIERADGPFELCHCNRCRKASGSAFVSALEVKREALKFVQGREVIKTFETSVRVTPPPFRTHFCGRCGSPVPNPSGDSAWVDVPAGLLDDDPQRRPDRHIFIDVKSPWFSITDNLPQLDRAALLNFRKTQPPR